MKKIYISTAIISIVLTLTSGCATKPYEHKDEDFFSLDETSIPQINVPKFSRCVADTFRAAYSILANKNSTIIKFNDHFKIESLVGGLMPLIIVNAYDDGKIQIFESKFAKLVSTESEKESYRKCLLRYSTSIKP